MYPRDKGRFALIDGVETYPLPTVTATVTITAPTDGGVCDAGAGTGEASSSGGSV